jgi:GNAT superfamily N-acetyltransferase
MGGETFAQYLPGGERRRAPSSAVVRSGTPEDLAACVRLAVAGYGGDATEWTQRFRERLTADNDAVFVAVVDDVVGYGRAKHFAPPSDAPANVAPTGHYLMGLLVAPRWRRSGFGEWLTAARLAWVWEHAPECWYFANATNHPSLDLHAALGFHEVTRDFEFPGVTFEGGEGVLSRAVRPGSPSSSLQ